MVSTTTDDDEIAKDWGPGESVNFLGISRQVQIKLGFIEGYGVIKGPITKLLTPEETRLIYENSLKILHLRLRDTQYWINFVERKLGQRIEGQ